MEYWLERCSICFDARLELCLDHCRDQYCLDCFRRQVVMSSWGLTVTKIKCPVCQIPIPQSEWSQFVPAHVVEHYNRYNRPYRSYSRCCPSCETEAVPCHYEERSSNESHPTVASIIHNLVESDPYRYDTPQVRHLIVLYQQQKWHSTALPDIYKHTMRTLMECSGPQWHEQMLAISRRVLMLEMKPEIWKQLQFAHISFFPTHACLTCGTCFCLKCGRESHTEMSCEESIRHLLDSEKSSENRETVRWTLDYSQQCPSCSILIHRDEGCNKVDCSLCGFCFCWVCRSSWSEVILSIVPRVYLDDDRNVASTSAV
ncbi:hypothetical protein BDF14DRAFT_1731392 [Spinellus fusiger]|nr:hypothetical protein BDF14DRAFT_1731392 [Spinellus fusiger]